MSYEYHGQNYAVFGHNHQPLLPEVCVDYLLDTLERVSGTWWNEKDMPRARVVGKLDFSAYDRARLRRVPEFVHFARQQAQWFEVLDIPPDVQPTIGRSEIYAYLLQRSDDFRPVDMVLIGGYVPWEHRRITHYHSFFVYESDPITGAPIMLSGNPGTPRLVSPEWEFRRTPKRRLLHRIRPRTEWLSQVLVDQTADLVPPPLSLPLR